MCAAPIVAIVHFTARPCVGGVEGLIAAQKETLEGFGWQVRLIVGAGDIGADDGLIPELLPGHPQVQGALSSGFPADDHPLVRGLTGSLRRSLQGVSQCWVHNALTVYLNPFLTAALGCLMREMPEIRWVAFCHDLSDDSTYVDGLARPLHLHLPDTLVVLSEPRRAGLSRLAGISPDRILVIPPPLDVVSWLGIGAAARQVWQEAALHAADAVLFVPAKLLPHKNLRLAVRVIAAMRNVVSDPALLITGAPSAHEPVLSGRVATELRSLGEDLGVAGRVHLAADILGATPDRAAVRDLMTLCDLVFLPSAEEGFGVPIQEAMALRAPVLCADIPAFRAAGGDYAELFSMEGDPSHIAAQAARIIDTPASRARRTAVRSGVIFREQIAALL